MNINDILKFGKKYSAEIMSTLAIFGVGVTAYLEHRAEKKTAKAVTEIVAVKAIANHDHMTGDDIDEAFDETYKEVVKENWSNYVLPVASGIGTAALIFGSNRISARKLAAAYVAIRGLTTKLDSRDRDLRIVDYNAYRKLEDKQKEDAAKNVPEKTSWNKEQELYYDTIAKEFFWTTPSMITSSLAAVNYQVGSGDFGYYNDLRAGWGLKRLPELVGMGWGEDLGYRPTSHVSLHIYEEEDSVHGEYNVIGFPEQGEPQYVENLAYSEKALCDILNYDVEMCYGGKSI